MNRNENTERRGRVHQNNLIDSYVDDVDAYLRLPHWSRLQALADLRAGLRAAALDLGAEEAVHTFGPAASTAERLASEYTDPFHRPWLPFGLSPRSLGARARAAMDPAGPWFVPRVVGIGWDLNLGRLARAVGLLNFDDLDDDVARAIPHGAWRWAFVAVSVPAGLAAAVAASGVGAMPIAPAHWPLLGPADRWAPPAEAFAPVLVFVAVAEALAVAALWRRADLPVRLALAGFGSIAAVLALGAAVTTRWLAAAPGGLSLATLGLGALGAASLVGAVVRTGRTRVRAR
ncbi:MAG TPA: DUF5808 domain-containing protein [Propionibacteriaceae bacterium]|nr:DUF5808 domain-containing protein [Propionibacteriaceae bacterium]